MTDSIQSSDETARPDDPTPPIAPEIVPQIPPPITPPPMVQQVEVLPRAPIGQDAGMRMIIPVGRAWQAIVSGYMGLLSILPGFGVLALIFGVWAIVVIKNDPKQHGMGRAIFGIIAGAIGTIFYMIVFIGMSMERGGY